MLIIKENLKDILTKNGLSEKESSIYLSLLELNETQPSIIAKRTNIKRPTVYVILEQLEKKHLVNHYNKNNKVFFHASDPNTLLKERENNTLLLKTAMPALSQLNHKFATRPQMSIFEGKNGLIQIMEDTLTTSTELLCWANPTIVMSLLADYYPKYIKKKIEKKIRLRGVLCYDKIGVQFKKKGASELREVYLIPKERFPFKNEINIYDDKVAIISHQDEVGIIIQNQNIADTQRAIFELGFEYAKLLEKDILTKEDSTYLNSDSKN